jgi:hypothetical protein
MSDPILACLLINLLLETHMNAFFCCLNLFSTIDGVAGASLVKTIANWRKQRLTTEAKMLGLASEYVHTSIQTDHEIPDLQLEYSNCICCHKIHWPSSVVTQRMRRVPNLFCFVWIGKEQEPVRPALQYARQPGRFIRFVL